MANTGCRKRRSGNESGFILALSILLVFMITISGMSFMQHDFLERRMAMNTVDNHGAFYVANAGIERAREVLKINTGTLTWTTILNGTAPGYSTDPSPDPLLCPDTTRGCTILPFGASVTSSTSNNLVFSGTFTSDVNAAYRVRVFNNGGSGDSGKADGDQMLTIRAMGIVRGEQKVLEATVLATSNLNLQNCATGTACANDVNGHPTVDPAPGREPAVGPVPALDFPLTNSNNYYRKPSNFSAFAPTVRTSLPGNVTNGSYYNLTGNVTIKNTTGSNVVIFTTGTLTIGTNVNLTNAILISASKVEFKGSGTINALLPYPAVISGGDVVKSSGSATVFGTIYAVGTIDFNPIDVHGMLIGNQIKIQGSSTYTDDHTTDPNNYLKYYALIPGLTYTPDLIGTATKTGTWREIQ